jgi:hypothetical protein
MSDLTRQFAVVFGAVFQIYASYGVGRSVGVIAQEYRSLILPATYAFAIWGPIFILCLVYAVYQALPAQRENPIFRAVGWWTAGAFIANGVWSYAYTSRQFILAQVILVAGFVFAGGAYLHFMRERPAVNATTRDNQLTAATLGLLFGWITAANIVGLAGTLIFQGFAPTGQGAEIGGGALLLAGGGVASFVILASRQGPYGTWVAYGAAVLWALVAVSVEQRTASNITTTAAAATAGVVMLLLLGAWRGRSRPFSSTAIGAGFSRGEG